ncbi:hypothetical protein ACFCV8_12735 [Streptomyces sp. NPDC056347]|uniref:hypothetical protein n=1 Tax=Streptomyces sp. NPDC056347 TaxID=3345790 RepID=UPI0035D532F3
MGDRISFHRNAFQETMVGLRYTAPEPDLFSQACAEQYQASDPTRFGYLFAQVFEPNVLHETAVLEGMPYDALAELHHQPTPETAHLAELAAHEGELSVVEQVNLAAALISISRFELSARILKLAAPRAAGGRESFEVWMLAFVVANRCDQKADSATAFQRMREAIEAGQIPPDRTLDACAQAVVWHMKPGGGHIAQDDFCWFLAHGRELTETPHELDPGAVSSWYRALAMVPAAKGRADETRAFMLRARDAADSTLSRRPRAYEKHLLKTYHESSLKEHMYVTRDVDRAAESGHALIALDPAWSPSYGELAEAYAHFGQLTEAAAMYDKAVELGPPYYGHHLLRAAKTHEKAGNFERALAHYGALSCLVPDNAEVLTAGRDLATSLSHESRRHFVGLLERLDMQAGERARHEGNRT